MNAPYYSPVSPTPSLTNSAVQAQQTQQYPQQQYAQQYAQQQYAQQPQQYAQQPQQYVQQPRQKYQPIQREGARRINSGTQYINWEKTPIGHVIEGWLLRYEVPMKFQSGNRHLVIELQDGSEVTVNGCGKLRHLCQKGDIVPGNYVVITYLGKETSQTKLYGVRDVHDMDLQVLESLDKSATPRFAPLAAMERSRADVKPAPYPAPGSQYGGYSMPVAPTPVPPQYAPPPPPQYAPMPGYQQQQYAPPPPPPQYAPQMTAEPPPAWTYQQDSVPF